MTVRLCGLPSCLPLPTVLLKPHSERTGEEPRRGCCSLGQPLLPSAPGLLTAGTCSFEAEQLHSGLASQNHRASPPRTPTVGCDHFTRFSEEQDTVGRGDIKLQPLRPGSEQTIRWGTEPSTGACQSGFKALGGPQQPPAPLGQCPRGCHPNGGAVVCGVKEVLHLL